MRSTTDLGTAARAAAFLAPLAVVPIVAVALKGGSHLGRIELFISGLFVGVIFGLPITYLAVLVVGYPAYKVLLAYGYLNAWALVLVGTLMGAVGGAIFVGSEGILLCGSCGLAVSLVAWLIIRKEVARLSKQGPDASPVA